MSISPEPPQKIRKLDNGLPILRITPIIDSKLECQHVPSVSYYALELKDKRNIGIVVKSIKELPEHLQHLKRVGKDGKVLIAETLEEAQDIVSRFEENGISPQDITPVKVPSIKPITRIQFENAKKHWATSFHPDKELENILDGSFMTPELREYVEKWSTKARSIGCIAVQNGQLLCEGSSSKGPLRHAVMEMVGKLPKRESCAENYLGTGCDVFLNEEPCAMCSMALTHFRIKRVFFINPSKNGVLRPGGWQLHLEPSINHHFAVFQVSFDENINRQPESLCRSL